jgi:hypothetical protein
MLVEHWGPEIQVHPSVLRDLLLEDIVNGKFDDGGLLRIDPGGATHDTDSDHLRTMFESQPLGPTPWRRLQVMAEANMVAIERGSALTAFCERHGLRAPSFWPIERGGAKRGPKAKLVPPDRMAEFRARESELHGKANTDAVCQTLSDEFWVDRRAVRKLIKSPRARGMKIKSAN